MAGARSACRLALCRCPSGTKCSNATTQLNGPSHRLSDIASNICVAGRPRAVLHLEAVVLLVRVESRDGLLPTCLDGVREVCHLLRVAGPERRPQVRLSRELLRCDSALARGFRFPRTQDVRAPCRLAAALSGGPMALARRGPDTVLVLRGS